MAPSPFPTYMQMRERVPPAVWSGARVAAGCAAACAADSTIVACNLNADEGPRSERWLSASKANGLLEDEEAVRLSLV